MPSEHSCYSCHACFNIILFYIFCTSKVIFFPDIALKRTKFFVIKNFKKEYRCKFKREESILTWIGIMFKVKYGKKKEARGGAVGWGTALQTGTSRVRFQMVSLEFFIDIIVSVDSASNRNEYQECFLGGKGGRCVGLTTLPPSCADYLKIWEPQPPGTLRACPGL
jgi:hypothetical protein